MLVFLAYLMIVVSFLYVFAINGKHLSIMYYNILIFRGCNGDYMEDNIVTFKNIITVIIIFALSTFFVGVINPDYYRNPIWVDVSFISKNVYITTTAISCIVGFIYSVCIGPKIRLTKKEFKRYLFVKMGLLFSLNALTLPLLVISFLAIYLRA